MRTKLLQAVFCSVLAGAAACNTDRVSSARVLEDKATPITASRTLPGEGFTTVPSDPPLYARVERPYIAPHDGVRAAIIFYRSPECVPPDFNLLDLLDIPRAFSCPMVTAGTEWYQIGAPPFMPPYLSVLKNAPANPVWIVDWAELNRAAADDILTITEIRRLPSLSRGMATDFYEWLEPFPTRNPSLTVTEASGTLPGGERFSLHYREDHFVVTYFRLRIF